MRTSLYALAFFLAVFITPALADSIPVSTFEELKSAIEYANSKTTGTHTRISIDTYTTIYIPPEDQPLPPIRSSIEIDGGTIEEAEGGSHQLFNIEKGASLSVRSTKFKYISHAGHGPTLFHNQGNLRIELSDFIDVKGFGGCTGKGACWVNSSATIENKSTGKLKFHRVRISNSGGIPPSQSPLGEANGFLANEGYAELSRVELYLYGKVWNVPLYNSGFMRTVNSSFMAVVEYQVDMFSLIELGDGAQTEFVNSVIDGFTGEWCGQVTSLGHNLVDSYLCDWASENDLVGTATGLLAEEFAAGTFRLSPSAASPAIDSADESWCPVDYLYTAHDGNTDGTEGCDRGAREMTPKTLAEGGINGLYYNPDADGHYVQILETDFNTLVIWNTFDSDGKQVWVYGVGDLVNGQALIAETYINREILVLPDQPERDSNAEFWGTLEVNLESCLEGVVSYDSINPAFGKGQFPISRLAYVKQLGCVD